MPDVLGVFLSSSTHKFRQKFAVETMARPVCDHVSTQFALNFLLNIFTCVLRLFTRLSLLSLPACLCLVLSLSLVPPVSRFTHYFFCTPSPPPAPLLFFHPVIPSQTISAFFRRRRLPPPRHFHRQASPFRQDYFQEAAASVDRPLSLPLPSEGLHAEAGGGRGCCGGGGAGDSRLAMAPSGRRWRGLVRGISGDVKVEHIRSAPSPPPPPPPLLSLFLVLRLLLLLADAIRHLGCPTGVGFTATVCAVGR